MCVWFNIKTAVNESALLQILLLTVLVFGKSFWEFVIKKCFDKYLFDFSYRNLHSV